MKVFLYVLHEYCHILQPDFHEGYSHYGLEGCDHFNFDTLNHIRKSV